MAAAPERALPTARLSRSALYAFAAVSVGAASCGSDTTTVGNPGPMYGAPPITGGTTGAGGEMSVPLYGIAPYTGGVTGAGGEMSAPHYGLPPPTGGAGGTHKDAGAADAAEEDAAPLGTGGGFHPLYGGPP
jgi:hypothetical protein